MWVCVSLACVRVFLCMCMWVCVCKHECVFVYMCVCLAYMFIICVCIYVWECISLCVYVCECVSIVWVYICVYMSVWFCVFVSMCECVSLCLFNVSEGVSLRVYESVCEHVWECVFSCTCQCDFYVCVSVQVCICVTGHVCLCVCTYVHTNWDVQEFGILGRQKRVWVLLELELREAVNWSTWVPEPNSGPVQEWWASLFIRVSSSSHKQRAGEMAQWLGGACCSDESGLTLGFTWRPAENQLPQVVIWPTQAMHTRTHSK